MLARVRTQTGATAARAYGRLYRQKWLRKASVLLHTNSRTGAHTREEPSLLPDSRRAPDIKRSRPAARPTARALEGIPLLSARSVLVRDHHVGANQQFGLFTGAGSCDLLRSSVISVHLGERRAVQRSCCSRSGDPTTGQARRPTL